MIFPFRLSSWSSSLCASISIWIGPESVRQITLWKPDIAAKHCIILTSILFPQSFSHLSQNHVHFFKTLHTVGFTDTHLSISAKLWCKMHYNHQNTHFTQVTHAAITIAYALSHWTTLSLNVQWTKKHRQLEALENAYNVLLYPLFLHSFALQKKRLLLPFGFLSALHNKYDLCESVCSSFTWHTHTNTHTHTHFPISFGIIWNKQMVDASCK